MPGTSDGKPRFLFYGGNHLIQKKAEGGQGN